MRSGRTDAGTEIDSFWRWFASIASRLGTKLDDEKLLGELDRRVHQLDPQLSWEVGPGIARPSQLVISPNLDRKVRPVARRIIAEAPICDDWEFYAARQPREWDLRFELAGESGKRRALDASSWTFVLLRYPDGAHEILLRTPDRPPLPEEQRWDAAAIVLEGILGEDILLDRIERFELVDDWEDRLAARARPIAQLRDALGGSR